MSLTIADLSFVVEEMTDGGYAISLDLECKETGTTNVVASTSPTGSQLQITDNGDGTYTIKDLPAGYYDIFVAGQPLPQPELTRIGHVGDHLGDTSKHNVINDAGTGAADLFSANKINSLLTGKSDAGHDHDFVYAVSGHTHDANYSPISHDHDSDYADISHNHDSDYLGSEPLDVPFSKRTSHLDLINGNAGKIYYFEALSNPAPGMSIDVGFYGIIKLPDGTIARVELGITTYTEPGNVSG